MIPPLQMIKMHLHLLGGGEPLPLQRLYRAGWIRMGSKTQTIRYFIKISSSWNLGHSVTRIKSKIRYIHLSSLLSYAASDDVPLLILSLCLLSIMISCPFGIEFVSGLIWIWWGAIGGVVLPLKWTIFGSFPFGAILTMVETADTAETALPGFTPPPAEYVWSSLGFVVIIGVLNGKTIEFQYKTNEQAAKKSGTKSIYPVWNVSEKIFGPCFSASMAVAALTSSMLSTPQSRAMRSTLRWVSSISCIAWMTCSWWWLWFVVTITLSPFEWWL